MNHNDLLDAVMQLDLEPIKTKLMHVASGEGWSLDKANAVEKEYRRFLCLMKLYPEEDTAPLVDVDTFWHYHILDTMKYAADCEQVFGYFLHHYPYVGMRGEEDEQFRLDSGERMRALYEATFGETYPGTAAATGAAGESAGMAFCASPHVQNLAFCASAHTKNFAFCASAHTKNFAFCASAHTKNLAFCASAHTKNLAFCASAHTKNLAFCASPHANDKAAAAI
jgi:hypothetical protein